ncbi:hypothetical protein [Streptomyces sp. CH-036]|uniref:hypothetical protein n=1 Tax=Streptomyces sp. CH-036 TaxID=3406733 RepID=UPI003C70E9BB
MTPQDELFQKIGETYAEALVEKLIPALEANGGVVAEAAPEVRRIAEELAKGPWI